MISFTRFKCIFFVLGLLSTNLADAQEKGKNETQKNETQQILPRPDFHFNGHVGRTYLDSDPAQFPQPVQAPKGAPNIVIILIDDAGFGQFSTFGGGVRPPLWTSWQLKACVTTAFTPLHFAARHAPH